jgi:hypothetical protein
MAGRFAAMKIGPRYRVSMTSIACKDCQNEFSGDVQRCPHCGANKPFSNSIKYDDRFILGVACLIGLITFCSTVNAVDSSNDGRIPIQMEPSRAYNIRLGGNKGAYYHVGISGQARSGQWDVITLLDS